jgi:coenzyme F420 hydrogenase subunit beta
METALSPTLKHVMSGNLCAGCGACAAVSNGAIAMEVSPSGYNRPVQRNSVTLEVDKQIAQICPAISVAPWENGADTHPVWGTCRDVKTGNATDETLRHSASSGGLLSALLCHGLEAGFFDAVVQISADPDFPTRNRTVISTDVAGIAACAGSRYAPSSPLAEIDKLLSDGRRYAFVGKPCDVSALRLLGQQDARYRESFPVLLSFFCGGIPSHVGSKAILNDLEVDEADLKSFRYRGDGWPGFATATRKDGSQARMSYADSWGGRLSHHVQFRCKICPDAIGGAADIVGADAWFGDESGYPLFDEQEGRSLAISRTDIGRKLLKSAVDAAAIQLEQSSLADVVKMQPYQASRKRLTASRLLALATCFRPLPRFAGVYIWQAARLAKPWETVKSYLGLVRRVVQGRV